MKCRFVKAEFILTALKPEHYPKSKLPEIAIVGRSNVGKSTLINHLLRNKKLAKTSSTPGKTQAVNFFLIDETFMFADLPGYGYAKVAKSIKSTWDKMMGQYITTREALGTLIFLFDIRREPTDADFELLKWALEHQKKLILVITKADKVSKSKRAAEVNRIVKALGLEGIPCVLYSATKNLGRNQLITVINEMLGGV